MLASDQSATVGTAAERSWSRTPQYCAYRRKLRKAVVVFFALAAHLRAASCRTKSITSCGRIIDRLTRLLLKCRARNCLTGNRYESIVRAKRALLPQIN